jgi:hypothetical protein
MPSLSNLICDGFVFGALVFFSKRIDAIEKGLSPPSSGCCLKFGFEML